MNKKIVIGGITLAVAVIGVVTAVLLLREPEKYDKDKWSKEYAKVVAKPVAINFNAITNTPNDYNKLRDKCNSYINSFDTQPKAEKTSKNNKLNLKTETGPIYYQDMLMLRYNDNDGNVKVATTIFDRDNNFDMVQLNQEDIASFRGFESMPYTDDGKSPISEDVYIRKVGEAVKEIIEAKETSELNKAEQTAIQVFTVDGKEALFKYKDNLNDDYKDCKAILKYAEAGKSDNKLDVKDRVYMQIILVNSAKDTKLVNLIMKLNKYNRVFDIDIL